MHRYRGNSWPSKIVLDPGGRGEKVPLYFGANRLATIEGDAPLRVVDTHPAHTASEYFSASRPCDLALQWSFVPSVRQISDWTTTTDRLVDKIEANLELYRQRPFVLSFFNTYIENPEGNRSVLETVIDGLRATGNPMDELKANMLQQIINGQPRDQIFRPFANAKAALVELSTSARSHRDMLEGWSQVIPARFDRAITDAQESIQ